jgi:3',5'-cyclic AMP phosphodiesterase CpdA
MITRTKAGFALAVGGLALALGGLVLALGLSACSYIDLNFFGRDDAVGERVAETLGQPVDLGIAKGAPYSFLVAADLHIGAANAPSQAVLDAFASFVAARDDSFVLFLGDQANMGLADEYAAFASFADGLKNQSGKSLPWFAAVGNHDLYNDGWANFLTAVYATGHGSSYSILDAGDFQVYLLDTGNATLGRAQYEELVADMGADQRPKIVISHYAIYGSADLSYYRLANARERALLLDLFASSQVKLVLAGHWHFPVYHNYEGYFEEWLCDSLTYADAEGRHCLSVQVAEGKATVERLVVASP